MTKRTKQPRLFSEMDKQEEYERALFTAVCMACGYSMDKITKRARGRVNEAIPELVAVNATVEEVAIVVRGMLAEYKSEGTITPQGITGNWPKFVGGTAADRRLAALKLRRDADMKIRQQRANRVFALDEATLNGLRAQLPPFFRDIPKSDCCFQEEICNLLDAEAGR